MLSYLIFAAVAVIFLLLLLVYLYPGSKKKTSIPGPDPSDVQEGNLPDVVRAGSLYQYLLCLHEEYGNICGFYWGEQFVVSVADPKYFDQQIGVFDRPTDLMQMFSPLIKDSAVQLTNGVAGRKKHQLLASFVGDDYVHSSHKEFAKVGASLVKSWESMSKNDHVPVSEYMTAFSFKVLALICFGNGVTDREIHDLKQQYDIVYNELESGLLSVGPRPRSEAMDKAYSKLRSAVQKIADKPGATSCGLLGAVLRDGSSPESAVDEMIAVLTAGYRPLSSWLCWCLYYVACHPTVQERVRKEIGLHTKSKNFAKLRYLRNVLDETLRCACVVPYASRVQAFDMQLGDHLIPKETPVIQAFGVVFQDEKFFEDPECFRPDRFDDEKSSLRPQLAFSPFGFAGKRQCPASSLTYSIAGSLLAQVLSTFKVRLVGEEKSCPAAYGLVTRPEQEVWIGLRPVLDGGDGEE